MRLKCDIRFWILVLVFLAFSGVSRARADVALLLEEPFGTFGAMNPTGHAALYLTRICAESPTELRRCEPNEPGVVISRYHRVAGLDWVAIPLIPYLYSVDTSAEIPDEADPQLEASLRDAYRREHLIELAPNDENGRSPRGEWIQLVGASYDRRIYGFQIETSEAQDDALIRMLNDRHNRAHFNLIFRNCADFTRGVLNSYYPKAIGRNYMADVGIMTPKQAAKSLVKYSRTHRDLQFSTFVIPQVPGTIHRSTSPDGVIESLVKSKKYVLPLVAWHPYVAGSLAVAYFTGGRFSPPKDIAVFDARAAYPQDFSAPAITAASAEPPVTETTDSRQTQVGTE
jgi:hypothetical protein